MEEEVRFEEIIPLKEILKTLRKENRILIAILYGSYSKGTPHKRSDIDLALYLKAKDEKDELEIVDKILVSVERNISILRLDDEEESPFVVQEALKGIHLIDPDTETLYKISHRVLHECEGMRFRKEIKVGQVR
ncbi:MAG: nucleotidyltransferase domain-containing protein [Nitrospirota bacterium]